MRSQQIKSRVSTRSRRRWPIRPGRDIVIEMTRENRPVEEIQAATNYSRGYIRNIQLELRGELAHLSEVPGTCQHLVCGARPGWSPIT